MYLSMNFRLTVITYVGFSVSICCMLLAILLFSLQGAGSTERDVIHLNLCISLLRNPPRVLVFKTRVLWYSCYLIFLSN